MAIPRLLEDPNEVAKLPYDGAIGLCDGRIESNRIFRESKATSRDGKTESGDQGSGNHNSQAPFGGGDTKSGGRKAQGRDPQTNASTLVGNTDPYCHSGLHVWSV